jgi:WD40 repeat protein
LSKIQAKKIATLAGHRDCVYALERSHLENKFISSGGDGLVAIWDLENPEIGKLIAQVKNSVYALKLIEERQQLLIGENMEGLHLIDLLKYEEVRTLKTSHNAIFDILYQAPHIILANADGSVQIIDQEHWYTQHTLQLSQKSARALALHLSAKHLAVAFSDCCIRILDTQTWKVIKTLEGHQNSVFAVAYSPCGKYLWSGSRDAHLRVWSVADNYEAAEAIPAHLFAINHIAFSPNGKWAATCSMDKSIKIWDTSSFRLLKVIDKARHAGHGTSVNKLLWCEYQNLLISGSDDRMLAVWQIQENSSPNN